MRGVPRHKTKFLKTPTRSDVKKKIKKELDEIEREKVVSTPKKKKSLKREKKRLS